MVRNYKRKCNGTSYDIDAITKNRAINEVIIEGRSIRNMTEAFNINITTLGRYIQKFKENELDK